MRKLVLYVVIEQNNGSIYSNSDSNKLIIGLI